MSPRRAVPPVKPFPVDPADVPERVVRAVQRTGLRQGRVFGYEDAALMAAVVIAALALPDSSPFTGNVTARKM